MTPTLAYRRLWLGLGGMLLGLLAASALLEQNNLGVSALSFDGYDFTFYLKLGPKIIFNDRHGGFSQPFSNLLTSLNSGDLDLQNKAETINYVDLRYDSKIVVGRKDQP